jgi:hypothetical protein
MNVETIYFRFFVGEEDFCKPIQVKASTEYGYVDVSVSNVYAYPYRFLGQANEVLNSYWVNSAVMLCPNENQYYGVGTYAVAVFASRPAAFVLSVNTSTQVHPLPPPPVQIACEDVPLDELSAHSVCMPDSVTTLLNFSVYQFSKDAISLFFLHLEYFFYVQLFETIDVVMPLPPGCHSISITNEYYNWIECLRGNTSSLLNGYLMLEGGLCDAAET